ncbi:2-amino-4-hydroxy-6-hydroxymethyldihydropteridine diphosphokinase [Actinomyces trachealis]|uniref:2-amino-4-hydroxy-6- hydroxymethyldihydropteridine diphosphokinase n=1 Tax=Actinomyces trachealis TaxID=2763540 RepID=UPI001C556382|nr:2-amino-4-hydroxy-6-hydroxymethyldihydropteridine diphosphokinase [Actinomyces trachealis]
MSVNPAGVTDRICLTGLSARGRHGVLPMEREEPQLFVVDLAMDLGPAGVRAASASDQLADSVDYSAVASAVITVIEGPSVNLIETLAARVADVVLSFPRVRSVEVTVHKPEAPLDVAFDDVAVTITRGELAAQAVGPEAEVASVVSAAVSSAPEVAPAEPVAAEPAGFDGGAPAFDSAPAIGAAAAVTASPALASEPVFFEAASPVPQDAPVPAAEPEGAAFDVAVGPLDGVGTVAEAPMDPVLAAALAAPAPAPFDVSSFESEPALEVADEVAHEASSVRVPEFPDPAAGYADLPSGEPFGAHMAGDAAQAVTGAVDGATEASAEVLGAAGAATGATDAVVGGVAALIAEAHAAEVAMAEQFGGAVGAAAVMEPAAEAASETAPTGTPTLGMPAADAAVLPDAGTAGATAVATDSAGAAPGPATTADLLRTRPAQPVAFVLALGGNVGAVLPNLRKAVAALRDTVGVEVTQVAPLARTAAITDPGSGPQPDFLNTVVLGMTVLSPMELLEVARSLEADAGRVRTQVHGPRTLDVDIVDYVGVVSADPELTIPHPRAMQRAFVLAPWAEVDDLAEIGGQSVAMLAENAPDRDGMRWLALDWEESDSLPALPTGQYVAPPLVADEVLSSGSASEPAVALAPAPLPEDEAAAQAAVHAAAPGSSSPGDASVGGTPVASAPEMVADSVEDAEAEGWGDTPVAWKDVLGGNQGTE